MTKREGKTEASDVEGLLGQDEAFIRTIVKTVLQEVLEAEVVEADGKLARLGYYGRTLI